MFTIHYTAKIEGQEVSYFDMDNEFDFLKDAVAALMEMDETQAKSITRGSEVIWDRERDVPLNKWATEVCYVCYTCGKLIPPQDAAIDRRHVSGHKASCRECINTKQRKNYAKRKGRNIEQILNKVETISDSSSTLHKKYVHDELAKFTPRQLLEELKGRGYTWEGMYAPRQKVEYSKI